PSFPFLSVAEEACADVCTNHYCEDPGPRPMDRRYGAIPMAMRMTPAMTFASGFENANNPTYNIRKPAPNNSAERLCATAWPIVAARRGARGPVNGATTAGVRPPSPGG